MRVAAPRLNGKNLAAAERAQRRRMIEAAGREAKAAERRAVGEGIDNTVALGEARGGAFTRATGSGAVRRQSGLGWLASQGKLTFDQVAAGLTYGADYRTVKIHPGAIRSNLGDHTPGNGILNIGAIVHAANARHAAQQRLDRAFDALHGQMDLVNAMNVICGQEKTPREAGGNAVGAAVITARLVIALDLLVSA